MHSGPATVVVESIFGPVTAFENDHATRQLRMYGAHTRNEVALLTAFVDEGDLVYDIGAHIGLFAIPLAKATADGGQVVAVEAEPANFGLLCKNLHDHNLIGRVLAVNAVVTDEVGPYQAVTRPDHTSATYFVHNASGNARIDCSLDGLHRCFLGKRSVSVVKIDVEGMELSVLRSAEQTVSQHRPVLYVEMSCDNLDRRGVCFGDVHRFLNKYEYRYFRNVGERNSPHDRFRLIELRDLAQGGAFYDLLAISSGDAKLTRAIDFVELSRSAP